MRGGESEGEEQVGQFVPLADVHQVKHDWLEGLQCWAPKSIKVYSANKDLCWNLHHFKLACALVKKEVFETPRIYLSELYNRISYHVQICVTRYYQILMKPILLVGLTASCMDSMRHVSREFHPLSVEVSEKGFID